MGIDLAITAVIALLTEAPKYLALAEKAKGLFQAMFTEGLISADRADKLFEHVDQVCEARLRGLKPPAYEVEVDPS